MILPRSRPAAPVLGELAILVATGPAVRASGSSDWPLPVSLQTAAQSDAEYDRAAALAAAGTLPEARSIFQAAAKQDPGDGALAAAVQMFRDLDAGKVSSDVVRRIFQAFQEGDAGKWNEAHAGIDEVLRLAPQYARAHSAKATLFIMQGRYGDGVAALDRALSLDSKSAEAYYNRGAGRAEAVRRRHRRLHPRHRTAAIVLGCVPEPRVGQDVQERSAGRDRRLHESHRAAEDSRDKRPS
jgi:tetratricopeptide (TPR) repeat protein